PSAAYFSSFSLHAAFPIWIFEAVVIVVEMDGLLHRARVNPRQAADGSGNVTIGARVVDCPVGVAFPPVEAAAIFALPIEADRGSRIHQPGEGPLRRLVPIGRQREVVILPGGILAEGTLCEQRTHHSYQPYCGRHESENPHQLSV